MKKVLFRILIICMAICCVLGIFTACDENGVIDNENNNQQENPIDEKDNDCQHEYLETIVNPTCTERGYTLHVCKKCGQNYKDTFTDALGHDYGDWTVTKEPTNTEKGIESRLCSRCQDTLSRDIPELNHEHSYTEMIVAPTCTAKGYTLHKCSCGYEYRTDETEKIPHTPLAAVEENRIESKCEENGSYDSVVYCAVCGTELSREHKVLNATGHDFGDWIETTAPTCTTKGVETRYCSHDNTHTETREIDKINHVYIETIIAPTCTNNGYTLHKCVCGDEYSTNETPAIGHDFGEWYESKAPSCTEEGELRRVCNNDSTHIETMAIAATGHSFSKDWTTDSGYHWHASVCGHNVISERGAHEYKIDVVPVTCETDGYTLHTCTTCGYSYKDNIIPATGHAFSNEWTTDSTYHWHTATCGHDVLSGKAAHTFGAATTVVPSCESEGYDYKTCSVCGYEYRYNIVPALGHIKSDVKVKTLVKATDSSNGYYTTEFYCERCKKLNLQSATIQSNGAIISSERGKWEENTVFSNVPYPENGVCTSLITSTENTAVGNYKGTVGAFFDNITRAQVKAYTHTLKNSGYNKTVTENDYSAYSFTAYHNTLNIFIAVGYDSSEMSIAVYKTGTVKKADNSGSGSSGGTVLHDITATEGLSYSLSADGKFYFVDGYSGTEDYVVIPCEVNGLPVKSIGGFTGNKKIKAVIILGDIERIEGYTFEHCINLKYLSIPDSLICVGDSALGYDNKLIQYDDGNAYYIGNEYNPYLILRSLKSTDITDFNISNKTKIIDYYAFNNKKNLMTITIPNSVTSIGKGAFYGCSSLTSITIPDSVTSIGELAFYGCSRLQYNEYDNGYYLGNGNNPYLVLVKAKSTDITSCTINNDTNVICGDAFHGCSSLTSITIPDSVTSIGEDAFYNCRNLKSIIIPNSITSIETFAFALCSSLTDITIPNSVTKIGTAAFEHCITLKGINIPNSVDIIGNNAFGGCSGLASVTIGNGVKHIGHYAFQNCNSLTSILIPDSVRDIGEYAFYGCSSLTSVYYKGTVADWNNITIDSYNSPLTSATRYYYSETEPKLNEQGTAYNDNYWHYVNGEIVIWTKEN